MTHTPWLLTAPFLSIVVKRSSVERSFPGGILRFEEDYTPKKCGKLYVIVCMSGGDVDYIIDKLGVVGLIPGEDLALNDTVDGPIIECPGIAFEAHGPLEMLWTVHADWDEPRRTSPHAARSAKAKHVIHIHYADVDFLALGYVAEGGPTHLIEVDGPTMVRIRAGEEIAVAGQGFPCGERGLLMDSWLFNSRGPGTAAFFLDHGDDKEMEAFEAIEIFIDGEQQPRPKGWFD